MARQVPAAADGSSVVVTGKGVVEVLLIVAFIIEVRLSCSCKMNVYAWDKWKMSAFPNSEFEHYMQLELYKASI